MTQGVGADLSDRTVMVTGASSGLGAAFARALAAHGSRVALAARRGDRLASVVAEIEEAGGQACAVAMDVVDEASVARAFDAAQDRFGLINTVLANAGVSSDAPALEQSVEVLRHVIDTNIVGAFLPLREGARRLIGAGRGADGRAVIISSITATKAFSGLAAYSASKAAVHQMGRVLAREWAREGLCVNMVLPGYIETEMNADFFASPAGQTFMSRFPRRRLLTAQDLIPTILHLSSTSAAGVTGSAFTIDDGQTL